MNEKPLISIIMPAYNSEQFIEEAIKSVINQTYENWELIVINDASTDRTKEKVLQIVAHEKRIRYFDNPKNQGVSKTRNKAVSLAKGKWIAFLDSDDMWKNDKLEKQVELLLKDKNARLLYTSSAFINENGELFDYILHVPEKVTFKELLKQNIISCSSVLVEKKYIEKFSMPGDNLHEDYTVWLRILQQEDFAFGIDEPLLIYRVSSKSKSGNKLKAALMQYRVYRYMGFDSMKIFYYMSCYVFRNIRKYTKIYKNI